MHYFRSAVRGTGKRRCSRIREKVQYADFFPALVYGIFNKPAAEIPVYRLLREKPRMLEARGLNYECKLFSYEKLFLLIGF